VAHEYIDVMTTSSPSASPVAQGITPSTAAVLPGWAFFTTLAIALSAVVVHELAVVPGTLSSPSLLMTAWFVNDSPIPIPMIGIGTEFINTGGRDNKDPAAADRNTTIVAVAS